MKKTQVENTIKEILANGNHIVIEFNNKNNPGVNLEIYDMIDDGGTKVPYELLESKNLDTDINTVLDAMENNGIVYPEVHDIDNDDRVF